MSKENLNEHWIDSDDAPELTKGVLKKGVWTRNGIVLTEAEGRTAFAQKLKEM